MISYPFLNDEVMSYVIEVRKTGAINKIMIDSGAFHVLEKRISIDQYMSYIDEYVQFVNKYIEWIDYVVTCDIPCDSRFSGSFDNMWRIKKTVENSIKIVDKIDDPRKFMIVIQGYTINEYLYCCDLYRMHGLITAKVGIGSLCIRKYSKKQVKEVPEIILAVKAALPSWVKLHTFGLNLKFLKIPEVIKNIHSSDSAAYAKTYSKFGRLKIYDPITGTCKEVDLVKNGIVQILHPITIWYWTILSFIKQVEHIVNSGKRLCNSKLINGVK